MRLESVKDSGGRSIRLPFLEFKVVSERSDQTLLPDFTLPEIGYLTVSGN